MSLRNAPRDIVVFLGAGFSCDAGLPTMASFGDWSNSAYEKLYRENKDRKHAANLLIGSGRVFRSFQRHCARAHAGNSELSGKNARPENNMETLFCMAEAMREAEVSPSFGLLPEQPGLADEPGPPQQRDSSDLLSQIRWWLWNVYKSLPPLDSHRAPCLGGREIAYEQFVHWLNQNSVRGRTTVLTTNYDIVFEYYAWALRDEQGGNHPCAYPLTNHWHYMELQAGEEVPAPPAGGCGFIDNWEHSPDTLVLSKLHGSINFFELPSGGEAQFGICTDCVESGKSVGRSRVPAYRGPKGSRANTDERPAILALDGIWVLQQRYGNSLVPAIVPPTYAKFQAKPWLRRIWNNGFVAIQNARSLVFIGYSMPETDGFMRAMIQAALASRPSGVRGLKVYVVNPAGGAGLARLRESYTSVFPMLGGSMWQERFLNKGFADAWTQGDLKRILEQAVQ
jgi:hypothetical protein